MVRALVAGLFLGVLLALAACARRPVARFQPYPEAEVAGVRDPHDFRGQPLCQACHVQGDGLREDPVRLCENCHRFSRSNHPVGMVQKPAPRELPLLDGKVVCHSCHDPHAVKPRKVGLRLPTNELCLRCHQGHG